MYAILLILLILNIYILTNVSYAKANDDEESPQEEPEGSPSSPPQPQDPKEGDTCTVNDPINFGVYKINSSGDCIMSGCKPGYKMNEAKNRCRCATCPVGYEPDNKGEHCYEKCELATAPSGETGWKEWKKLTKSDDLKFCYKCNNGWTLTKNDIAPCHKRGSLPKKPPYKIPRKNLTCPPP